MVNSESIIASARKLIKDCQDIHKLLHEIKPIFFGKEGPVAAMSALLRDASHDQKRILGQEISIVRKEIEALISEKLNLLNKIEVEKKLESQKVDGSLPSRSSKSGIIHPITFVADEIIGIFEKHGFTVNTGPEVETDFYNFSALNIPPEHPARQMHDTFYLNESFEGKTYLLRTHTTTVDIRELQKNGAPIKSISFGRTFRCDSDRTHSPMFHQIDMMCIDKDIHMGHLKSYLNVMLKEFFETNSIGIRLRPSFFPFTEPSAEVDICYRMQDNKIVIDANGDKFMEILGCGMLHPNVLKTAGVDADIYQGIAFGLGVERMAMLKYGISDLREFFVNDEQWLIRYGFDCSLW